jgi:hypothetical protein
MLKKILSTFSAALLLTSVISIFTAPTANAVAPVITSTSTISSTQANPSVVINTSASALNSTFANWTIGLGTTGLTRTGISTNNGIATINFSGTARCGGTLTIRANAAAFTSPTQTENSNTLSFEISGEACSSDATLSATSTIKGVTVVSLGTPGTNPGNITARGSVHISTAAAADTSNSGSYITNFITSDSSATKVYVWKHAVGGNLMNSSTYNGTAAISDGDIFSIYVQAEDNSTYKLYAIDVQVSANGPSSSSTPAICSSEQLSSSSTIKGVAFDAGTRQASSTDFNGAGSSNMGSITLTEAQASGNGVTSIVATGGATATWLHVGPSINSWGNDDISTTANLAGVTLAYGELFEIKISGSGCADYYRISITVESEDSGPTLTEEEIAANAAAQTEAQAAAVLATALATAKVVLATQFSSNKPVTLQQFLDANYGVRNSTVAANVSAAILKLPVADRDNSQKIHEIVNFENFIDRVAVLGTRSTVRSTELVSRGLLPAESIYKHSVIQGLGSYPDGSLNSIEKIAAAVKEQIAKAEAPKRRLAEIKAQIAARKK